MADSKILAPFILSWEGGFANHPKDPGGATMRGIILSTFRRVFGSDKTVADLKAMTDEQWHTVYKKYFWDRWRANEILSQSVANLLVDWVWASGAHGVTKVQQLLGVKADGVVGPVTLSALNGREPEELFRRIHARRRRFIETCRNFDVFGRGWLRRLNAIGYGSLLYNGTKIPVLHKP